MTPEAVVGIDLGTSTSCVATVDERKLKVIQNRNGERVHASVIAFLPDKKVLVGNAAKKRILLDPANTVYSAKRLIGRFFSSPEVTKARENVPYEITQGENDAVRIHIRDENYNLSEISAFILKEMKAIAEEALQKPVNKAVITVPAYFNDNQRTETKKAGEIAGLKVLRIINEPTAAALAYGFGGNIAQKVVVYDFGGGTLDISVLEIGGDIFEVIATAGDTYLGGDDMDNRLVELLANEFMKETKVDLRRNTIALQRLKEAAEWMKIKLSKEEKVSIDLPQIASDANGAPLNLERTVLRAEFEKLVTDLIQRTIAICDRCLQTAELAPGDIDGIILVGGPTRLPVVQKAVKDFFGKEPLYGINPEEVVAIGAAIQGQNLVSEMQQAVLLDVTPLTLSVGTVGGFVEPIIERNNPIPCERTKTFTTSRDGQEKVAIKVYQGESQKTAENELLGEFEFSGFKVAFRGEVNIEVTFEIDTDGIVNVNAKDIETGLQASTQVKLSAGLTPEEVEKSTQRTDEITLVTRVKE